MPEDTTLDAFVDDEGHHDLDDRETAVSTAAWSSEPVRCPRCGEGSRRRFRAEDGSLVCPDCKRW